MKRRVLRVILLAVATGGIYGCVEKRIAWSPDGRLAAVIGTDGVYLTDADGHLSKRLVDGAKYVAWFADSRRLLVAAPKNAAKWEDVTPVLSPERQKELLDVAGRLRQELLAFEGDFDNFEPKSTGDITPGEFVAVGIYVRDHLSEGLAEKIGDKWNDTKGWEAQIWSLRIYEISDKPPQSGGQFAAAQDLSANGSKAWAAAGLDMVQGLDEITEPRIAPDGKAVSYLSSTTMRSENSRRLVVTSLEKTGSPRVVDELVSNYPDWSADGHSLVYAKAYIPLPKGNDTMRLGSVVKRDVRDGAGETLAEFPEPESLAGVIFDDNLRVRTLKNGSVIFTAMEVTLPSTPKDMPQRASLFMIDPNRQATVSHVVPREAEARIGDAPFLFEVSPDESRLCVPGSNGKVTILALATGEVTEIDWGDSDKLRTAPVWRNERELCFGVKPGSSYGSPNRAELLLVDVRDAKPGNVRVLSKTWPDEVVDFLKKEEEKKAEGGGAATEGEK